MKRHMLCLWVAALLLCLMTAGMACAEGGTFLWWEDVYCTECGQRLQCDSDDQTHTQYCVNSSCSQGGVMDTQEHFASCVDPSVCGVCGYPCDGAAMGHVYHGAEYLYDETGHWQACVLCGDEYESQRGEHLALCGTNVCVECGMTGDMPTSHYWANGYSISDTQHYKECLGCGEVTYSADHVYSSKVIVHPDNPAVHGRQCSTCGYVSNDGAHTDTCLEPDVCQYCAYESEGMAGGHSGDPADIGTDEIEHWFICEICGEEIYEEHSAQYSHDEYEHWKTCTVCGLEYERGRHERQCTTDEVACETCGVTWDTHGFAAIAVLHRASDEYAYDESGHHHECLDCGEQIDRTGHEYLNGYLTTQTEHVQECGECGYQVGYAHQADCQNPGVCKVCEYKNANIEIMHRWNPLSVTYDADEHWYYCSACNSEMYRAAHSTQNGYQYDADSHWYECDFCYVVYGEEAHGRYCDADACRECGASGDVEFTIIHEEENEYRCTDDEHDTVCWRCGEYIWGQDHYYGSGQVPVDSYSHAYVCQICGHTKGMDLHWASCQNPGVCTYCGYEDVSLEGQHRWNVLLIQSNDTYHWYNCVDCGAEMYKEAHTLEYAYNETAHWLECSTCGLKKSEEAHGRYCDADACRECGATDGVEFTIVHEEENEYRYTDEERYKACWRCGEYIWGQNHTFGTPAVIEETPSQHGYTCQECGYILKEDHRYSSVISYDSLGHSFHCDDCDYQDWYEHQAECENPGVCKNCGYEDAEMQIIHYWDPDDVKGDATYHWYICLGCGEEVQREKHTRLCSKDTSVCSVCGMTYTGVNYTHASLAWTCDAEKHWQECLTCGKKVNTETHVDEAEYYGVCDWCGGAIGDMSAATGSLTYICLIPKMTENNFTFSIRGASEERGVFTEFGCKLVDLNTGTVKVDYVNNTDSNLGENGATRFDINSWTLPGEAGHTYTMQLYMVFNGEKCYSPLYTLTFPGKRVPLISDIVISDVTPDGYTITCRAASDSIISKVEFPTWNSYAANGDEQDDLVVHAGTKSGTKWSCRISVADGHMNQTNCVYYTGIRAYDVYESVGEMTAQAVECCVDPQVYAVLTLPEATVQVKDEAFAGASAQVVIVPEGCTQIGARAFADCPDLQYVLLPIDTEVTVAADAFEGSAPTVLRAQ